MRVPDSSPAIADLYRRRHARTRRERRPTTRVSVDTAGGDANGRSDALGGRPSITGDGEIVAFASFASDLATGDSNGHASDVFVRDLATSTTTLVTSATSGGSGASLSDDGRFVAYQTTQVWVRDRQSGSTAMASARYCRAANGISGAASLSAGGRYVSFHTTASNLADNDGNGAFDIYVRAVSMPSIESIVPSSSRRGEARPRSP